MTDKELQDAEKVARSWAGDVMNQQNSLLAYLLLAVCDLVRCANANTPLEGE